MSTTWCANQRIVAQTLGCKTSDNPDACYQAIVAQYEVGDWEILAAGDCNTATDPPGCEEAWSLCSTSTGPTGCWWEPGQGVPECLARAMDQGMSEQDALPWCEAMAAVWVVGCTTRSAYLACDPIGCDLPCSHGRDCAGPQGSEVCSRPCDGTCEPALVFGEPWTEGTCSGDLCALQCDQGTCPPLYTCGPDGACWPD